MVEVKIEENKDITHLTTFGIPVKARYFAEYASEKELLKLSREDVFVNNEVLHIGGGSDLLFLDDFNGLVIHSGIKGIKRYDKDASTTFAIVGAGVKWTDFIEWCLDQNLAGVENLAHIPGEVGASAVQNVGAYGVEAKDVIHAVECFDTETRQTVRFTNEECRFGYRDSFFKHEGRGRYYVLRVSFRLRQGGKAESLEYGPLKELPEKLGHYPSVREVAEAVTEIRDSKLPDPALIGSAGSFFKNPVVSDGYYNEIKYVSGEEVPAHALPDNRWKLSAAWLIDHTGLKSEFHVGGASVYPKQVLVIVNRDNATAKDVAALAEKIRKAVKKKYLVNLQPEVNYIDTDMTVTVLGSGTSKGVPEVGCDCDVCRSDDPRDKRLRASVLVRVKGLTLLIDPSPDFREQALRIGLDHIDAVLITHSHYDHVGGIDDLRPFCGEGDVPMYVREDVDRDLRKRLDYCFREHLYPGVPKFDMHVIGKESFYIDGVKIEPVEVMHGPKAILGYRIGKFAYVTDAKEIPASEMRKLYGLDVLILNALRYRDHFSHLSVREALDVVEELEPKHVWFTHFNHEIGCHREIGVTSGPNRYGEERIIFPENVKPAYDGLTIRIDGDGKVSF